MVSTKAVASSEHRAAFALRCHRFAARQRVSKSICHSEFPESTRARAPAQGSVHSESLQERHAQIEREFRERELRSLRMEMTKAQWWQRNVDAAANNAARQNYRNTLFGELDAMINAKPPSEPTTEVVYVDEPEDDTFCGVKIPRWR